jgi:hypothetical protein
MGYGAVEKGVTIMKLSGAVEIKRWQFAFRIRANGLRVKPTDGAIRQMWRELAKAGEGTFCVFDYVSREVILYRESTAQVGTKVPLP